MLFAAVILLRFYLYAAILHAKRKEEIENNNIVAVSARNRSNIVCLKKKDAAQLGFISPSF